MQYVPANEFVDLNHSILDVRSPGEFTKGHIPGAINIPLFSDEERAEIGTLYRQTGQKEAIDRGYEIANPKKELFKRKVNQLTKSNRHLSIYCWRGGMRSRSMAELFETADLKCMVLEGGYKAYRKYGRELIDNITHLTVLAGPTGSGKTELLHALADRGEQIVDLERLAQHRGSAFGAIALPTQPTTEQFHNRTFEAFRALDLSKRIWIESESKPIGRVYIDETLWAKMNVARVYAIAIPRELRIHRITAEYGAFPRSELIDAVQRIAPRLGHERMQQAVTLISCGEIEAAVDLLLTYYDRGYLNSRDKHKKQKSVEVQLIGDDCLDWAQQLVTAAYS